jgi:hydroxyacylglutathione hydrolase
MLVIRPIPAFDDNYIWLLRQEDSDQALVVDPGDEEPVIAALTNQGLRLAAILLTHHHQDHIGGVDDLLALWPQARVFGPRDRRIRAVTDPVGEGDVIRPPGLETAFQVLEVPGHTATHIAYLGPGGALFCGDTLFAAGCGRVFDGTFDQLAASLERISGLPAGDPGLLRPRIHPGQSRLCRLGGTGQPRPGGAHRPGSRPGARRSQPSVPSTLAEELATNPFLRTGVPAVKAAAEAFAGTALGTSAQVFTALRRWKDERYD